MTYNVDFPFYPRCLECGGNIEMTQRSGRSRELAKGVRVSIPDYFPIPTCESCGEELWAPELSEVLDELLKKQLGKEIGGYIARISGRFGVTQAQIGSACRVSHTYLSHVTAGRKTPSGMLLELLRLFVEVDGAFEHAYSGAHKVAAVTGFVNEPCLAKVFEFDRRNLPGQEFASAGTFGTESTTWTGNDRESDDHEYSNIANVG